MKSSILGRVPNWSYPLQPIEVRPQRLRHHHAAVRLLIILEDREPCAAHGQTAAVQSVQVLRFAVMPSPEAKIGAACLKRLEVGAGRDLLVFAAGGQPHLEVISLGGAETEIAAAERDDAV